MIPLRDDNPTSLRPVITVGLIAVTTLAFIWQLSLGPHGERVILALGVVPARLFGKMTTDGALLPPVLTIFTSIAAAACACSIHRRIRENTWRADMAAARV